MAKSYEQPVLNSDSIIISDARILIKDYDETYQFKGIEPIDLDALVDGWQDAGLVSAAALNVTKDEVKLEVGLPKTTVKTAERSREVTVSFNFHELSAETVGLITGAQKNNVVPVGLVSGIAGAVITLPTARAAAAFKVGDIVSFWDASTDALVVQATPPVVQSVSGAAVTLDGAPTGMIVGDYLMVAGKIASASAGAKTVTMTTDHGDFFAQLDFVTYATIVTEADCLDLISSTERAQVASKANDVLTLVNNFPTTPVANDIVVPYRSVEMVDQLNSQIRRALMVIFDYQDAGGRDFQYAIYFPRVKATGAFSPDFKGGENYADVPAGFSSEAVTMTMADGESRKVMMVPYVFAV